MKENLIYNLEVDNFSRSFSSCDARVATSRVGVGSHFSHKCTKTKDSVNKDFSEKAGAGALKNLLKI